MKRLEISLDVMRENICVPSSLAQAHAKFVETTRAIVLDWLRFNQKQVEQQFSWFRSVLGSPTEKLSRVQEQVIHNSLIVLSIFAQRLSEEAARMSGEVVHSREAESNRDAERVKEAA